MEACDCAITTSSSYSVPTITSVDLESAAFCETVKRQMSSLLAMAVACKMRLAGPDSSRLVLQSLLPSSSSGSTGAFAGDLSEGKPGLIAKERISLEKGDHTTETTTRQSLQRRYSATQLGQSSEPAEGVDSHADQLLQMFSSRLQSSSQDNPSYLATVAETGGGDTPSSQRGLTRQGSSPVLSSLAHTSGPARATGGLVQGYLTRGASSSALQALGDVKQSNSASLTSTSSTSANSTHTVSSGPLQAAGSSASAGSSVDSTDAGMHSSRGFGVLARTRQFGAWLGQVTHGEKIEVTKKDINVFAPTSF